MHASRLIAIGTEVAFTKMQFNGLKVQYVIVCVLFPRKGFEDMKCSSFFALPFKIVLNSSILRRSDYYNCLLLAALCDRALRHKIVA